jgi:hypothetical protein
MNKCLHELAGLCLTAREVGRTQKREELGIDAIDPEVNCAARRLRTGFGELQRPTRITAAAPPRHEGAEAIIAVLKNDCDAHVDPGDEVQLAARQCLAGQGFLHPIIITDDRADPRGLEFDQELLVNLLCGVGCNVAAAGFAYGSCDGRNRNEQKNREQASPECPHYVQSKSKVKVRCSQG